MSKKLIINLILWISLLTVGANCFAQTADFVYQGKLNDGATAANGTYQFEFRLYDAATGGNQIGNAISNLPATVTNGIFAVNLDFGANAFDGAARFLEIGVRLNGSGQNYTTLNPRQAVTSTPYAVKSLKSNEATTAITSNNTLNLGGIAANQYVQTIDSRLSDDRNPKAGSANYIQNTTVAQSSANFNISGEGKANKFSALTQFDIGGNRVLSVAGAGNVFVGVNTGTTGASNAFVGFEAGKNNISGSNNSFFGANAGRSNSLGANNVYFGANAGFAGFNSGGTFLGFEAGKTATLGVNNTAIGFQASVGNNLTNATAIGANSFASQSNSIVLGTAATSVQVPGDFGVSGGATFDQNLQVGNTIIAPKISIFGNLFKVDPNAAAQKIQFNEKVFINEGLVLKSPANTFYALDVKGTSFTALAIVKDLRIEQLSPRLGTMHACFDPVPQLNQFLLAECADTYDRRSFDGDAQNYQGGLDLVKQLRPVSLSSKKDNRTTLGFVAEEVNKIEPRFAVVGRNNEISGVKYELVTVSLVSAMQEQQKQIEEQQKQIEALKALICQSNANAAVCQK